MLINVPETLKLRPMLKSIGFVDNREEFSARCPELYGIKPGLDIPLRFNGDKFDTAALPAQFHSAFRKAEAVALEKQKDNPHCMVHLSQGLLPAGDNFRVIRPHTDPEWKAYPVNDIEEETHIVVSDALTTAFYDQAFEVPDYQFAFLEDIQWRLCEIFQQQVDPTRRFIPEPYQMIEYGPYTVHEAQLSDVPTKRTFMLNRFY